MRRVAMFVVLVGCAGEPGPDGLDGRDGMDGDDGSGVTVATLDEGSDECPAGGLLVTAGGEETPICNGEAGEDGQGGSGGSYAPALSINCSVSLDILFDDDIPETGFGYDAIIYSNGDAEVSCTAAIGSAQAGAGRAYYPAVTLGAQTLFCAAKADYPPTDTVAGSMYFELSDEGPQATYTDAPNAMDGSQYTFKEADCRVRLWNGKAWSDGELADL